MTLFEFLEQNGLLQNNGIDKMQILEYQKKLYNAGKSMLPVSYVRFLEGCNGIQTDSLSLFGVNSNHETVIEDVFERNKDNQNKDRIFLGDNFNEHLVYTWSEKEYSVLDKKSGKEIDRFSYIEDAFPFFLRDHLRSRTEKTKSRPVKESYTKA